MYYLKKFCRICIKTDETLLELDSKDYDFVTHREKLELCTKMVVGKDDPSTMICTGCVKKLRMSYVFQEMCTKSNDLLREYLAQMLNEKDGFQERFVNSELRVTLSPIPRATLEEELEKWYAFLNNSEKGGIQEVPRIKTENRNLQIHHHIIKENFRTKKKRVSKGQRCSLLKKLLSTINNNTPDFKHTEISSSDVMEQKRNNGGLKDLLVFIKDYDFGYKINQYTRRSKDTTPLDKLEHFSRTFFYTDFTAYRNTILSVIDEKRSEASDDEDMFNSYNEEEDKKPWLTVKQEPVDSEIATTVKTEMVFVEPDLSIKQELMNENEYEPEYLPSKLVQACYDDENCPSSSNVGKQKHVVDDLMYSSRRSGFLSSLLNHTPSTAPPSSLELLQQFTNRTKGGGRKTMNPLSLKCRTRGQPFINPMLMEQFKKRSFKCDKCNRSFKSPGYLHSHCTKMGH